ncbi:MAG: GSCFA domain-containing protein [Bacteroidetes bacterium]|nr:GSCFA domain-containing protein [Bacteroidota bacterium]
MDFHLQFPIQNFPQKTNYAHSYLFIGSCFAENIGETMQQYKFNVNINPHGALYNPASIALALRRYIDNKILEEKNLFFEKECWHSWEHHSKFSNIDKQECLAGINKSISNANDFIKKSDWLFITFGSAFIYKQNETNKLVGNCHKVSQKEFAKSLLSVNEIVEDYKKLIHDLKKLNSKLKIIFTVSPVRYVRDGVVENNLSKARLIEAVHEIVQHHNDIFYFPAYELVIDDLRDYRFYKEDLVHPNQQAISYVFDKLMETVFDEQTKQIFEKVKEIILAKQHRPFNKDTREYQRFKTTYLEKCKGLQKESSFLNLSDEINFFR